MGGGPEIFHGSVAFALARRVVERGSGVSKPRDVITEEITSAQVGQDLLNGGGTGEVLYSLDQSGAGECLALSQLVSQELITGLAPTALGDADLQAVLKQADEDCPDGRHVPGPGDGVDHHIVKEDLAKSPASVRVY